MNLSALLPGQRAIYFAQKLAFDPDNPSLYLSIGQLFENHGLGPQAAECYRRAKGCLPKDQSLHQGIDLILSRASTLPPAADFLALRTNGS